MRSKLTVAVELLAILAAVVGAGMYLSAQGEKLSHAEEEIRTLKTSLSGSSVALSESLQGINSRLFALDGERETVRTRLSGLESVVQGMTPHDKQVRDEKDERLKRRSRLYGEQTTLSIYKTAQISTERRHLTNRAILLKALAFSSVDSDVEAKRSVIDREVRTASPGSGDSYYDFDFLLPLQDQFAQLERIIEARIHELE